MPYEELPGRLAVFTNQRILIVDSSYLHGLDTEGVVVAKAAERDTSVKARMQELAPTKCQTLCCCCRPKRAQHDAPGAVQLQDVRSER